MVLLDDDVYQATKDIVLGNRAPHPIVADLAAWFSMKYSVKVLNIQFGQLKGPKPNRYRLYVIIENTTDHEKMYVRPSEPNREIQQQVARRFRELALKHRFAEMSQLEDLFVIYNDFSEEAKTEANWKARPEVEAQIVGKYPAIWKVLTPFSNLIVFYYSDADIVANEAAGLSTAIADAYFSILRRYDVLGYFTRENINIKFDSKENVDANYEGNLFYYSR